VRAFLKEVAVKFCWEERRSSSVRRGSTGGEVVEVLGGRSWNIAARGVAYDR